MMLSRSRVLLRTVQANRSTNVRHASDWNSMAEAFIDPSKTKPIRRNQSSTSSAAKSTAPSEPAKATLAPVPPPATPTTESTNSTASINEPLTISKALGGISLNDFQPVSQATQDDARINWSDSFHGLGSSSFNDQIQATLAEPIAADDIEITPDGLLYLPEIKYRRVLNKSFGAGGWGLAPRSETIINKSGFGGTLTREYALICQGQLVGIARGEQDFFSDKGIPTATEGCKSNALMRCCKDLGIASELWDPKFIRTFKKKYCEEVFVEHIVNKKKKKIWKRKDGFVEYPFKKT